MRFLRILLVILIVIGIVAGIAIWTCPADVAYGWYAKRLGPLRLTGVSGSVWQGHAASAQLFGQELGALDWKLDAAPLFGNDLIAHVTLAGASISAAGVVERDADKRVHFRDVTFRLPASIAAPAIDIPALQLGGEIEGTLANAMLNGMWLDDVHGTARWKNPSVSGAAQAHFGDIDATFSSTPNGTIAGVIHDLGGSLQVNGTFHVVAGGYDVDANLAARDHDAQVTEALQYIGQAQADGSVILKIQGRLLKLF